MFCYIWEFIVAAPHVDAFTRAYGPEGAWVELFSRDPGYIGTELLRDSEDPRRFLTVDHWISREVWIAFRQRVDEEFQAIDRACEAFTEREAYLGDFELVARLNGLRGAVVAR